MSILSRGVGVRSLGRNAPERRVVAIVSVLLMFEASIYSAITPILPHYAHSLHVGKPAIGVLTASYPAGNILGSLLAGWLATRVGARITTLTGLFIFAVSLAGFGFSADIVTLDWLRFVQGVACGCLWVGGLTWLIAVAPSDRRGELIAAAVGAAIFGLLVGPVLGIMAEAVGTRIIFPLAGALAALLAIWVLRQPDAVAQRSGTGGWFRVLVGSPVIRLTVWLIFFEGCALAALATLLPLRLSRFGASGTAIGAIFLAASLTNWFLAAPIGRVLDRRGAKLLLCIGAALAATLLAVLPLLASLPALALLTPIAIVGVSAQAIPAIWMITQAAQRLGVPLAVSTTLFNLTWAAGATLGAPAAAEISHATSDAVSLLLLAATMVITLAAVLGTRLDEVRPVTAARQADASSPGTRTETVRITN